MAIKWKNIKNWKTFAGEMAKREEVRLVPGIGGVFFAFFMFFPGMPICGTLFSYDLPAEIPINPCHKAVGQFVQSGIGVI